MSVTWLEHRGKRILFSDYRGCKSSDAMIKVLYEELDILSKEEGKVLVMAHYDNSNPTGEYFHTVKKFGKEILKHKTEKTATLGINGMKRLLFNTYISWTGDYNVRLFKDQESAIDWLVSKYY